MNIETNTGRKEYSEYIKNNAPKSKLLSECMRAFLVGGVICAFGQLIRNIGENIFLLDKDNTSAFTCIVLILFGAFLTGIGVYDVIGRFAGAGSIVPITGFANSMVSPALEFKREGFILGVGAKLFTIAGPVLVYGISASILAGIYYFLIGG